MEQFPLHFTEQLYQMVRENDQLFATFASNYDCVHPITIRECMCYCESCKL